MLVAILEFFGPCHQGLNRSGIIPNRFFTVKLAYIFRLAKLMNVYPRKS